MELQCLGCGKPFTVDYPYKAKGRRFCTRACYYRWHRGANNPQTRRIETTCAHCGKPVQRLPSHLYKQTYCSRECASAEHGAKISGPNHPNWRGGSVEGRGPTWQKARRGVIDRQGGKCLDCGMTEAAHISRYGRSLHVHHRSPYRLTLDNSPDNLIAVCTPCHGIEESATRRKLSPADFITMQDETTRAESLGLNHLKSDHVYDDCPRCGARKAKRSALCRACRNKERALTRKPPTACPICGGPMMLKTAKMCWACRVASKPSA